MTVAVIALLFVLAISVAGTARDKANVTRSVTNLRSIAAASLMFSAEHGGRIALYGDPKQPNQTQGSIVEPRGNQMPRALFEASSVLGGHSFGGGPYLRDTMVFHNPRLTTFKKPQKPSEEFGRAPNGRQNIGYFYYSLPGQTDGNGRSPAVVKGNTLSNERPANGWSRTPLYSDVPDVTLAREYGYTRDEFLVAHLDGSVSNRSKQRVFAQPSLGAKLYYMATGLDY